MGVRFPPIALDVTRTVVEAQVMQELLFRYRGPLLALLVLTAWLAGGATWHCLDIGSTP